MLKLAHRRQFLHLATGAPPYQSSRGPQGRKPIRRGRCASSSAFLPAAGSTSSRLMGQWLSERLGQQFVIDNRPGGGSDIGTEAIVRAQRIEQENAAALLQRSN
jgi:hypothetical protein